MRHEITVRVVAGLALLGMFSGVFTAYGAGEEWSKWRGPDNSGITADTDWTPAALAGGAKTAWKVNVGEGYSAVSVKGGRLYTMGNRQGRDILWCLDVKDGKEVWNISYPCDAGDYAGPRATPVLDGDSIYIQSRNGDLRCVALADGKEKWKKNLTSDFQAQNLKWGFSASVLIDGESLFVNAGKAGLCLNKKTGAKIWSSGPGTGGYAVPVLYTAQGRKNVAIFGQKEIYGVDAATGKEIWSFPWETAYDINAADPIVSGDIIFFTSGYNHGCAALNIAGGKVAKLWENKTLKSQFSSTVLIDGHVYGVDGNAGKGDLVCVQLSDGAEKWRQKVGFGSLIVAAGKIICLNESGTIIVAEAVPTGYKEIASAKNVLSKTCWTAPVLSGGLLYCRNNKGDLVAVKMK
jgi:outer membrane protein assembly factor BamB